MNHRLAVISLLALAADGVVSLEAAECPTASPGHNAEPTTRPAAQSPTASSGSSATPTPLPQPTPWPPPPNAGAKGGCMITKADGSFIPPAERQCSVMVVWAHLEGFTGDYEVELQIQPWD